MEKTRYKILVSGWTCRDSLKVKKDTVFANHWLATRTTQTFFDLSVQVV
jgi:hypothetical protein